MSKIEEIFRLAEEIGINDWDRNKKPIIISQLKLVYGNLNENHKLKEIMGKYIKYYEEQENSGITMDEFTYYGKILKKAGLVKDVSKREFFRKLDEENLKNGLSDDTNNAISSIKQKVVNLIPFRKK